MNTGQGKKEAQDNSSECQRNRGVEIWTFDVNYSRRQKCRLATRARTLRLSNKTVEENTAISLTSSSETEDWGINVDWAINKADRLCTRA